MAPQNGPLKWPIKMAHQNGPSKQTGKTAHKNLISFYNWLRQCQMDHQLNNNKPIMIKTNNPYIANSISREHISTFYCNNQPKTYKMLTSSSEKLESVMTSSSLKAASFSARSTCQSLSSFFLCVSNVYSITSRGCCLG